MILLGYFEGYQFTKFFGDVPVLLPNGWTILERDIEKAVNDLPFVAYQIGETEQLEYHCPAIESDTLRQSLGYFSNFLAFGLPNGNGWRNELAGILELLKELKSVRESYLADQEHKEAEAARKAAQKQDGRSQAHH